MTIQTNRYVFIDYVRSVAIIFVVLCHAVEAVYSWDFEFLAILSDQTNFFRITAFALGRTFGVPFFLMITGYLLLDRTYDVNGVKQFYINNWLRLIVCTMAWFALYDIFVKYYSKEDLSLFILLKDVLFLHKGKLGHQWYMPMIIGYYAMIPFVATALKKEEAIRFVVVPYFVVLLYVSVIPFINKIITLYGLENLENQLSGGFTGGIYGLYIVLGWAIKRGYLKKCKTIILVLIIVTSTLFLIWFTYRFYRNTYSIWYDSPFVIASSVSLFEVASRLNRIPSNIFIKYMAKYSFGVYLVHWLIRDLHMIRNLIEPLRKPVQVIVLEVLLLVISYILVWLIGKIPKFGKLLCYIK